MGEMSAEEALELYQLEKSFSAKEALLIEPDVELSLAETQRANTEMLLGKLESANEDLAELRSALFKSPTKDDIKRITEQEKAIQDMQLNIASNTLFGTSLTDRAQLTPEEQALMTAANNAGNDILTEQFLKSEMNDIPKDLATFRA